MKKETKLIVALVIVATVVGGIVAGYLLGVFKTTEHSRLPFENCKLTLSNAPALNQTATLTCTVTPVGIKSSYVDQRTSVPGILRVVLENGLEWVDDNILENWNVIENICMMDNDPELKLRVALEGMQFVQPPPGNIVKGAIITLVENVPFTFEGIVKSVRTGQWYIDARVSSQLGMSSQLPIYVSVSENSAEWGEGYSENNTGHDGQGAHEALG
jgi:hypothetical protein